MKQRIFLIDNLKYILIFLVVLGHYIEPFIHDNEFMMAIYMLIYSFHMPLFAFASGFFAKPINNIKELKKPLLQFITFEIIYAIIIGLAMFTRPDNMEFFTSQVSSTDPWSQVMLLFTPVWILWYLWAMLCWKLLISFIPKKNFFLILSFIFAILVGAVEVFDGAFSLQRVFCFFPFYFAGYFINYDQLTGLINKVKPYRLTALVMIPIALFFMKDINYSWFYFSDYYAYLDVSFIQGALIRTVTLIWAMYMSLMVLCYLPVKQNKLTKYGTNTLYIYLGHGVIMIFVLYFNLFSFEINLITFILLIGLVMISMMVLIKKPFVTIIDILSWRKNG